MKYTYKEILLISFPVMMGVLVEQLINITDAIFLGHVGEVELGASAIASVYYLVIYMLGFGFGTGLQVVIARRNGEKLHNETGKTFFQGLYFLFIFSVVLFTLSMIFAPVIMKLFVRSDEIYIAILKYLNWRSFGLLFAFPIIAFRAFLVGILKTKILIISSVVMVLVNIVLNYYLIFGNGIFPAYGISGAAMASSIAEAVALLVLILYMYFLVDKNHYNIKPVFDIKILKNILKISVWSMLYSFISVAPWLLFFIAIEHLGKNQLAIANIIRSISTIFFIIVSSLATITGSFVSNLIGEGKNEYIIPLCNRIIRLGYFIGIPLIMMSFIFYKYLIGIYTSNHLLISEASNPFIVMLLNYFFAVPSYVYCNVVMGMGKTKTALYFQLVTIVVYVVYLYLISHVYEVALAVYWLAEYIFVIVLLLLSFLYVRKQGFSSKVL